MKRFLTLGLWILYATPIAGLCADPPSSQPAPTNNVVDTLLAANASLRATVDAQAKEIAALRLQLAVGSTKPASSPATPLRFDSGDIATAKDYSQFVGGRITARAEVLAVVASDDKRSYELIAFGKDTYSGTNGVSVHLSFRVPVSDADATTFRSGHTISLAATIESIKADPIYKKSLTINVRCIQRDATFGP